jgi:hypothetical protein
MPGASSELRADIRNRQLCLPAVYPYPYYVASVFVASLARPGGNATGFASPEYRMSGKWLELLKQISPAVTWAAFIRDPTLPAGSGQLGAL